MTVLRLVISEYSEELDTRAPRTGEFERLSDAKRHADRHQEFIFTELVIESEYGDLIAYRPSISSWVDCADIKLFN